MRRTIGLGLAVTVLVAAAVLSRGDRPATGDNGLRVDKEGRNPWTHLRLNNEPSHFQFAIVSDRTGGHRPRVFSRAVERLNLLQPEFVLSVGDLIEGYTEDEKKLAAQWRELDGYVSRLKMPFFYVAGNHDLSNLSMEKTWQERYGRRYYHFVYREVLFLALCSEDPPGGRGGRSSISKAQLDYVRRALAANRDARWTVVALHKPMWVENNGERNGWAEVEDLLDGRRYTVFAGHVHRYQKFVRRGMNYYQLATTGGSSKMRGVYYGEFDHIAWVTMTRDGPVIANIMLDGVLRENLADPPSDEEGVARKTRPTHFCTAKVAFQGKPVPGAVVVLWSYNPRTKRYARVADARGESDGRATLSTYKAFDGVPEGEYVVTIVWREPLFDETGRPTANKLPDRYATPEASPLRATVRAGDNFLTFDLTK